MPFPVLFLEILFPFPRILSHFQVKLTQNLQIRTDIRWKGAKSGYPQDIREDGFSNIGPRYLFSSLNYQPSMKWINSPLCPQSIRNLIPYKNTQTLSVFFTPHIRSISLSIFEKFFNIFCDFFMISAIINVFSIFNSYSYRFCHEVNAFTANFIVKFSCDKNNMRFFSFWSVRCFWGVREKGIILLSSTALV